MDKQNWNAVWEETRATMAHLEQCLEQTRELERSALLQQQASTCSDGVAKTLEAMRESIKRARQQVRAAELNLRLVGTELDKKI